MAFKGELLNIGGKYSSKDCDMDSACPYIQFQTLPHFYIVRLHHQNPTLIGRASLAELFKIKLDLKYFWNS